MSSKKKKTIGLPKPVILPVKKDDPLHEVRQKYPLNSVWIHNKTGKRFIIVDHALLEQRSSCTQVLVYAEVGKENEKTFVRPVSEWTEEVEVRMKRPRFEMIQR